ncbi:GNAT family N-acetyltransferase [Thiomicrolovo sp. ZZH C-3]
MQYTWLDTDKNIDWQELSDLYRAAPLGDKPPEKLKTAFSNSLYKYFVYASGRLVGVGRALADGVDCSYICDVAVHPYHQGKGLGRQIVSRLVERSKDHNKIILYANPGAEPFYEKLGFARMNTAMAIFKDQEAAATSGLVQRSGGL